MCLGFPHAVGEWTIGSVLHGFNCPAGNEKHAGSSSRSRFGFRSYLARGGRRPGPGRHPARQCVGRPGIGIETARTFRVEWARAAQATAGQKCACVMAHRPGCPVGNVGSNELGQFLGAHAVVIQRGATTRDESTAGGRRGLGIEKGPARPLVENRAGPQPHVTRKSLRYSLESVVLQFDARWQATEFNNDGSPSLVSVNPVYSANKVRKDSSRDSDRVAHSQVVFGHFAHGATQG
jgi:hypothetical protein